MRMILSFSFTLLMSGTAAIASAGSLAQETEINQGLFHISVADEIRKRCDVISPRLFIAITYMESLKKEALRRGYSDAEIDRYVHDKTEKAKMRARSDAYIREQGAEPNDGPSLCILGLREIEMKSPIGALLKAR
ncbi:MAG: hypothetical protein COW54_02030 [Rhodobacteraceae bacterium CG17_big_fil_post_rev_8_21_14_2_50_63_15]|nr:DUF5333 domain-containing protein [Roseovarius sp.]PIV79845.1 MAG: hypothetical protein COW54_02030 [Rhodobacteraceae bacterium CG17_big_fil_post_rev_8_21_14_2_50_63_15]